MELYKTDKSTYTVILCTFYGAPGRVRQKYADLWVSKGCSVVTLSVGRPDLTSRAVFAESTTELVQRAKQSLDTLIANGLDRKMVIFHIISEGGISSWLRVMNFIEGTSTVRSSLNNTTEHPTNAFLTSIFSSVKYKHIKPNIVGYVLDSCPYHFGYISTYRALWAGHPFFQRMGFMFLFTIQCLLKRLVALIPFATRIWPSLTFASMRAYREKIYTRYLGTAAQLYVWSSKDNICSPNYIAHFAASRQSSVGPGVINTLLVEDAPHVQILRLHPGKYEEKVVNFINRLPGSPLPLAKM